MLVDLKTILADTREKHYAVGLFNCVTLEMTKGILAAAEELHSPVIIGPAESLLPGASLAEYADMMLGMARRAGRACRRAVPGARLYSRSRKHHHTRRNTHARGPFGRAASPLSGVAGQPRGK